jgi:hypothetical protein
LDDQRSQEKIESCRTVSVTLQKGHQKSKTDEYHDVDVLEICWNFLFNFITVREILKNPTRIFLEIRSFLNLGSISRLQIIRIIREKSKKYQEQKLNKNQ